MAAQGQIPGQQYGIGDWSQAKLKQWLQQNMNSLMPQSVQSSDVTVDTASIGTALTLSPSAVTNLQAQLGVGGGGSTWFSGAGSPSAGLGSNGDFYLNSTTDDIDKKVAGAWVFVTNIKGATGSTGATGATGATGPAGGTHNITVQSLATGPPASPATGDIWIATGAGANGETWQFVYDNSQTTYKWCFIGGSELFFFTNSNFQNTVINTWENISTMPSYTTVRAGVYFATAGTITLVTQDLGTSVESAYGVGFDNPGGATNPFLETQLITGVLTGTPKELVSGNSGLEVRGTVATAGHTIKSMIFTTFSVAAVNYVSPWMTVRPVAII